MAHTKPTPQEIFQGNLALLKQRVAALEVAAQNPKPDADWLSVSYKLGIAMGTLGRALQNIENNTADALKDLL